VTDIFGGRGQANRNRRGDGVGKTALVSWIILWALATMRDTTGVLTASNEPQLRTRNRAELEKWHRLCRAREFLN
jgi:hypothetical protein